MLPHLTCTRCKDPSRVQALQEGVMLLLLT